MSKPEGYLSLDIETDGPAPGLNSMLSLGAVLFDGKTDDEIDLFYARIKPLEIAVQNKDTMQWWQTQPSAWEEVNNNPDNAALAIGSFIEWTESYLEKYDLTPMAKPAAFDFPFVNYYSHKFFGRNPLGYSCLDIRSYIGGILRQPSYYGLDMADLAKIIGGVNTERLRPHVAVDDAIKQGRLFMAVRRHVINTNKAAEELWAHTKKAQNNA